MVISGKQTLDGDTGQVGPGIAERLGIPFVAYLSSIDSIENGLMKASRTIDEGHEVVEVQLPCVISVSKEINTPRLPSLRGTMKSKSAQIPSWTAEDLQAEEEMIGVAGSPTRVIQIFSPKRDRQSLIFEGNCDNQVTQLIEKMIEVKII